MPDSADWLLKIISGPHQGAEVALRPGRLVVGSHPECDLVLHDVLVAPQHFALTLGNGRVTVEPLEGRVYANGKRLSAASPVPEFGFVTVGTTHLVLGPAAARWPLLSPADVPELEKEPAPNATAATEKTESSASNSPTPTSDAATGAPADKKTPKPPTAEQRRRALWTAGVGGVLLIVWLVLWLAWTPRTPLAPSQSVRERAEQVLRAFPDAKTVRLEQQGERLIVTGYLESDSVHRELTSAFRNDVPEVALRIWSTPRMLETARALLAERNLNLDVSAGESGELRVRGAMRTRDEWSRTHRLLLAEVPGLQRVHDDITFPAVASAPRVPVAFTPVPPNPPVSSSVAAPPEAVSVVALQELGDGQGWLRLSNGTVLFRGAKLVGSGHIAAFRDGRAIVEHGDARLALTVGADLTTALRTPLASESPAAETPATPPITPAPATPATAPPVVAKKSDPQNG